MRKDPLNALKTKKRLWEGKQAGQSTASRVSCIQRLEARGLSRIE